MNLAHHGIDPRNHKQAQVQPVFRCNQIPDIRMFHWPELVAGRRKVVAVRGIQSRVFRH